jgi:CheY-like chemotaxis protein
MSYAMNQPNLIAQPCLQTPARVRTLLVDDSQSMREFLTTLLGFEGGFELVGTATDGRQALRCAAALRPDLILMDVQMPILDGLEATRMIKQFGAQVGYNPVIVMVTADDTSDCRFLATAAGADGFVAKTTHLGTRLRSTLDRLFPSHHRSSRFDPLEDCCETFPA